MYTLWFQGTDLFAQAAKHKQPRVIDQHCRVERAAAWLRAAHLEELEFLRVKMQAEKLARVLKPLA